MCSLLALFIFTVLHNRHHNIFPKLFLFSKRLSSLSNNSPFILPPGWLLLYTNYTSIKLILKIHCLHPAPLPALTWDNFCSLVLHPSLTSICLLTLRALVTAVISLSRVSTKHTWAWLPWITWGLYSLALIQEGVSSLSPPDHESFCLAQPIRF